MQSSTAMQQSCILMAKGIVSCFPMNKAEEMEKNAEEEDRGGGGERGGGRGNAAELY